MVKLTLLYGRPADPEAFELYYATAHREVASKMRGIARKEVAKVVGTTDSGQPAYYRVTELYFDDLEHFRTALATPEVQATMQDLSNFATGGVTTLVSEIA